MKKLLGLVFALAILVNGGIASAQILKNLKVGGNIDFQANSGRNVRDFATYDKNDRIGDAVTRVLVDVDWDLLDDMHAKVTLRKNDRAWGTDGDDGQGPNNSQSFTANGNNDVLGNVFLDQAYIKVDKMIGQFDAQLGRQFFGEPGDLVIYFGPKKNYGMYVTTLDAFRADYSNDMIGVTGVAGKVTGAAMGAVANQDVDVRGLVVGAKNLPVKLDAFIYNRLTHGTGLIGNDNGGKNDNLYVYGLKVKGEAMGGWVMAQVAMNAGENRDITTPSNGSKNYIGRAALLDAGYKADVSNVGAFTPWLNFGWGSGLQNNDNTNHQEGFQTIASDYAPGIINGRFNGSACTYNPGAAYAGFGTITNGRDVSSVGLNNRIIAGFGLKMTPAMAEKLVAGLSFWDYRYHVATRRDTAFRDMTGEYNNSKRIGSEIGLTLDWKHSENVQYGVGYAHFIPGGFVKTYQTANARQVSPIKFAFADLSLKF